MSQAQARRALIMTVLQASPGLNFRALCRATSLGTGNLAFHLSKLSRQGLVINQTDGALRRIYPTGQVVPIGDILVREDPELRRIRDFVAAHPGCCQKDVIAAVGGPASSVQYRLHRLVAAGAVTLQWRGRWHAYYPAAQPVAPLASRLRVPGVAA